MALTEAEATQRAEATVRAYVGWHLAPERSETLTLDGPGSSVLLLPTLRVTAITSITEDGSAVDPGDYEWSSSGVVRRNGYWSPSLRGLEVSLTHGYAEMPLDVAGVIERLTTRVVEGAGVLAQVGQVSYAEGEDGLPVGGTLTSLDRAVLDRYKLPPRP
jgi:hypothetical protein